MVFKKKNMIVFENENKERICLYPEFLSTSLSFSSTSKNNVSVNVSKNEEEFIYLKEFYNAIKFYKYKYLEDKVSDKAHTEINIDSDIEFNNIFNSLKLKELEDGIILDLIYNTKKSSNFVKVLSPYFNGKTSPDIYFALLDLYNNMSSNCLNKNNSNNKVKKKIKKC